MDSLESISSFDDESSVRLHNVEPFCKNVYYGKMYIIVGSEQQFSIFFHCRSSLSIDTLILNFGTSK